MRNWVELMSNERFEQLLESVREGGAILRGKVEPSRAFVYKTPRTVRSNPAKTTFAICIETDDPALLEPRKIYEVRVLSSGRVKVLDEEGEAAIYPAEYFILVDFPAEVRKVLARVAG